MNQRPPDDDDRAALIAAVLFLLGYALMAMTVGTIVGLAIEDIWRRP